MADLKRQERDTLRRFFMPCSWVLTHQQLAELFKDHKVQEIDGVDPSVFQGQQGGSKTDHFNHLFEVCPNQVMSDILLEVLDDWLRQGLERSAEELAEYEECKLIAEDLAYRNGEAKPITLSEPYFERQKELVLKDLSGAKFFVWVCMYRFTDADIASKLLELARKGLSVELVLNDDEDNRKLDGRFWQPLKELGCSVWWYRQPKGINHHKHCIIDNRVIWKGCFNFTWYAAKWNQEAFERETNEATIGKYGEEFKRLKTYTREADRLQDLF